jgi:hypothetical protein
MLESTLIRSITAPFARASQELSEKEECEGPSPRTNLLIGALLRGKGSLFERIRTTSLEAIQTVA